MVSSRKRTTGRRPGPAARLLPKHRRILFEELECRRLLTIDLGMVQPVAVLDGLILATDSEEIRFETTEAGRRGDFFRIEFAQAGPDLDLELLDADGHRLRDSESAAGEEEVSLNGLPAGVYFARVYCNATVVDPTYDVKIQTQSPEHRLLSAPFTTDEQYTLEYELLGSSVSSLESLEMGENELVVTHPSDWPDPFELVFDVTRVTSMVDQTSYEYDLLGNPSKRVDAQGEVTTYDFDGLGRLTERDGPGEGDLHRFTYDANSNLTSIEDATGVTQYAYDELDRLTLITMPGSQGTIGYEYDLAGRVTSITYPDSTVVAYGYDAAGRLQTVTEGSDVTTYSYCADGALHTTTLPNGITATYTYDDYGRLRDLVYNNDAGLLVTSFHYTTDGNGNRTAMEVRRPNDETPDPNDYLSGLYQYQYDSLDRLVEAGYPDGSVVTYTYDDNGNRLSMTTDPDGDGAEPALVEIYHYGYDNRLEQISDDGGTIIKEFCYDPRGNVVMVVTPTETTRYEYDFRNLLIAVEMGDDRIEYVYDANGDRVAKSSGDEQTTYVNDPTRPFTEVLLEVNGSGTIESRYTYGLDRIGGLLPGETSPAYFVTDALGSTTDLSDGTGGVLQSYSYDAFGLLRDTLPAGGSGVVANELLFAGEDFDPNTGLLYLRARYYDLAIGTFLSKDPSGFADGLNLYAYVANNPVNVVDPSGLRSLRDDIWRYGFTLLTSGLTGAATQFATENPREGAQLALALTEEGIGLSPCKPLKLLYTVTKHALFYEGSTAGMIKSIAWGQIPGTSIAGAVKDIWLSDDESSQGGIFDNLHYGEFESFLDDDYDSSQDGIFENFDYGEFESFLEGELSRGGVYLGKAVDFVGELSDLVGATVDPVTGQVILLGRDGGGGAVSGLRLDDFVAAVRAIFGSAEYPGVSINYTKGHYQDTDYPYVTSIFAGLEDTDAGWVMLEADHMFKALSLGKDFITGEPLDISIPGYMTIPDRYVYGRDNLGWGPYTADGGYYFAPADMQLMQSPDGQSFVFDSAAVQAFTFAYSGEPHPVHQEFIFWINDNWDALVEYEFPTHDYPSDLVDSHPDFPDRPDQPDPIPMQSTEDQKIFGRLEDVAKAIAFARFLYDHNIPIDFSWIENYELPYRNTPLEFPSGFITQSADGTFGVIGGVTLRMPNVYLSDDGTVVGLGNDTISARPDSETQQWSTNLAGEDLSAVALSLDSTHVAGLGFRSDTDLYYQSPGNVKLGLTRVYSASAPISGVLGFGWDFLPGTMEFTRPEFKTNGYNPNAEKTGSRDDLIALNGLRQGEVRVVDMPTGQVLTFSSSFYGGWDDTGSFYYGGINAEGVPDFAPSESEQPDGSTLTQDPTTLNYTLTRPDGSQSVFDHCGRLLQVLDVRGRAITYSYTDGRVTAISDSAGQTITLNYDGEGRIDHAVGLGGEAVDYTYDAAGDLVAATRHRQGETITYTYTYDADHHLTSVTLPSQVVAETTVSDILGRVSQSTDARGNQVNSDFDLATRTTVVTDTIDGATTVRQTDDLNRPLVVTDPLGRETQFAYQGSNRSPAAIKTPDPSRPVIYYNYDDNGNVVEAFDAVRGGDQNGDGIDDHPLVYEYDDANNLIRFTDARGIVTEFAYNEFNQQTSMTRAVGTSLEATWTSEYDPATGYLTSQTDPTGVVTVYAYDALGNPTQVTVAPGTDAETVTKNTYDEFSRLTRVEDGIGRSVTYEYNGRNQVTATILTGPEGTSDPPLESTNTYDPDTGWRLSETDFNGNTTTYAYDAATGDLTQVDESGAVTRFDYDRFGNLATLTDPVGNRTYFGYDRLQRLTRVVALSTPSVVDVQTGSGGVVVAFSEPIDTSLVDTGTDVFVENGQGQVIPGTVSFSEDSYTLTWAPDSGSLPANVYTIMLRAENPGEFTTQAGILLDGDYSGSFPTGNSVAGGDFLYDFSIHVSNSDYAFDFGTGDSPIQDGHIRVWPATSYESEMGYGWLTEAVAGRDTGTGSDLTRDLNATVDAVFAVDVPDGTYNVQLTLGDHSAAHDDMGVFIEGIQVDLVSTSAGEFVTPTYEAAVLDGQLTVRLADLGGSDPEAVISGLRFVEARIQGWIFEDAGADGVHDAIDAGLEGQTVYLDLNDNRQLDAADVATTTDASGFYAFVDLEPGEYAVRQVLGPDWKMTYPEDGKHSVVLTPGLVLGGRDFGSYREAEIHGTVWEDFNGNASRDVDDAGLAGWTVFLDKDGNQRLDPEEDRTATDVNGDYFFDSLTPGAYSVHLVAQPWYAQSTPGVMESFGYVLQVASGSTTTAVDFAVHDTPLLRFDFGTESSPTAYGYTQVLPTTTYDVSSGYGWLAGSVAAASGAVGLDYYGFTLVADSGTPVPGGLTEVSQFGGYRFNAAIDGDAVLFSAEDGFGNWGLYRSVNRSLEVVADNTTPIPGESGLLQLGDLWSLVGVPFSVDDGKTVFHAFKNEVWQGLYLVENGVLSVLADNDVRVPGFTQDFYDAWVENLSLDGDSVVFAGRSFLSPDGTYQWGVYIANDGSLTAVADRNTPIPNASGNFTHFYYPTVSNGTVAFYGKGADTSGIYVTSDGGLRCVADTNTLDPTGNGVFRSFKYPMLSGDNVVFSALDSSGRWGIYSESGGVIAPLIDRNTQLPDGSGSFSSARYFSVSAGNMAFLGSSGARDGVFIDIDGVLMQVIDESTTLDGKALKSTGGLLLGPQALDGDSLAFHVTFSDGEVAIYRADRVGLDLTRDLHSATDASFAADVPRGTYDVTITMGDAVSAHDAMAIFLEGEQVDLVSTDAGEFQSLTYRVFVQDGQLTARFEDRGGENSEAVINAMEIKWIDPREIEPNVEIVEVQPDPRDDSVAEITIEFNQAVSGFDLSDLELTRDGGANLLTGSEALATSDNMTWRVSDLSGMTASAGQYELKVIATGSGIRNLYGNELESGAIETWTVDTTAPTVVIPDVWPDPRNVPVDQVLIEFTEPVAGFDLGDLQLTRDGGSNLLDGSQSLTSSNSASWILGGLTGLTNVDGTYQLILETAAAGISDTAGNALAVGATASWLLDGTPPTVAITEVTPQVRNSPIDQVTLTFSEPVSDFYLGNLNLSRDGGTNLLTADQTLTSADNVTWILGELSELTDLDGGYHLSVIPTASGIKDSIGNALEVGDEIGWLVDVNLLTVDVIDVAPDPRATAVDQVDIVFGRAVTGFEITDLQLTLNGGGNLLTVAQNLDTTDGITWTLSGLSALTAPDGTYQLTLTAAGSGIQEANGSFLLVGASDLWTVDTTPPIAGIVDIAPDPRNRSVTDVTILFSEPVTGFGQEDLQLTRDGGDNLLTAAQTLVTTDSISWTLGNLQELTALAGTFTLTLSSDGTDIEDLTGNPLASGTSDTWLIDHDLVLADVLPVAPNPPNTSVDAIDIQFTRAVIGFDLDDLSLTRDGGDNLLSASQTLTSADGVNWTLSELDALTGAEGRYELAVVASGSGIQDHDGNFLLSGNSSSWSVDLTAPAVTIAPVAPDPRNRSVNSLAITFSEPVTGFGLEDLQLTRDGGANLLTGEEGLSTTDGAHWSLDGLTPLTSSSGEYELILTSVDSGVQDLAGHPLASSASELWTMDLAVPTVVITPISPDPRAASVDQATIVFSEPISGLDLADFQLTHNGGTNLLTAAQTLTTTDNTTWTLGNMASLTSLQGNYQLVLQAAGSGIRDAVSNAMMNGDSDSWTVDTVLPTVDIVSVLPDPRNTVVDEIVILFSEAVTGFDLADLRFTLDGGTNLLTAAQTLSSDDNIAWTLGNLAGVAGGDGVYQLTLTAAGSGILDTAGNPLPSGDGDSWFLDATVPTADIVEVTPDPRNSGVSSITVVFSEAVTGFDVTDLQLARDGGSNLLTPSQMLSTLDNVVWTLGNLSGVTGTQGSYQMTLAATGSSIRDAAGNTLASDATDSWTLDTTALAVEVVEVVPEVRNSSVSEITFVFSSAVSGLDLADLHLTRDGGPNLLTGAQTLTTGDSITWTLGNLAALTGVEGDYQVTLTAAGSDIRDIAGNALGSGASDSWVVDVTAPSVDIIEVTPDPRNASPDDIAIIFSEPIAGLDMADLRLTRDGGSNLLTGAQTLTTNDSIRWTLGNLSALTGVEGDYQVTLTAVGSGIADLAGNALGSGASDSWRLDPTIPTVDIIDASPDPRTSALSEITLVFSEVVLGFELADLRLTRDGGPNLLMAAQTLTTSDDITWTLHNVAALTGAEGSYQVTLTAAGSGIQDLAGNPLGSEAIDTWVLDITEPTGDILDVEPDPRNSSVSQITIGFDEAVTGFELSDLTLTRDGGANLLTGAQTLTTSDNITWMLGNLAGLTDVAGSYQLTLTAAGSGVQDLAGNALGLGVSETWVLNAVPKVDIVDVVPDPRTSSVNQITVVFSEAVTGFDLADLTLTRDGGANLLTGAQTLTTSDDFTWTLGDLAGLTGLEGSYELTLTAAGSGIQNSVGNPMVAGASDAWVFDAGIVGPRIVSTSPALDGVLPPPVSSVEVTFSEPIDPVSFQVSDVSLIDLAGPQISELAQFGGRYQDCEVVGSTLYAATKSALKIFDISDPTAPVRLGGYATSGELRDVEVVGDRAYLADWQSGLQILDVSDPAAPVLLGAYDTSGAATYVHVVGDLAYVADFGDGLQILDVSDPAAPVRLGGYDTSEAWGVDVVGTLAYVADYGSGLQILDVSDPAAPIFLGNYDTPGSARGVDVVGSVAYVADYGTLQILDVSNSAAPSLLDEYYPSGGNPWDVQVIDEVAYLANGSGGVEFVDVSVPTAPVHLGEYDMGHTLGVEVVGDLVYVADDGYGLHVLNVSNLASPEHVGEYDGLRDAEGVQVVGDLIYIAGGSSGLQILDVSDPAVPVRLGEYTSVCRDVHVVGDLAYIAAGASGLLILDVGDPTAPNYLGYCDTSGSAVGVQVVGNVACIADDNGGLATVDVSDPAAPVLLGGYDTPGRSWDVDIVGDLAYVADLSNGLQILNMYNPAAPVRLGGYDTSSNAVGVQVVGNLAYVADYTSGLKILDVSDPTAPVLLGGYDTSRSVKDVHVVGTLAYVAKGSNGIAGPGRERPDCPGPAGWIRHGWRRRRRTRGGQPGLRGRRK